MRRSRAPRAAAGRLLPAVLVAFLSLLLVLAAVAQPTAAQPPAAAFGERIDVVLVEVEAVVVDRQGRRVAGLGRGDFRLLVDGEPVEIDVFEEVREGRVVAATDDPAAEAPAAAEQAAAPAVVRYLVFVDQYFGADARRAEVLGRLRADLAALPAGDPMAVVAWTGRRLDLLTPWTTERRRLDQALEQAAVRRGPSAELERRGTVSESKRDRLMADQLAATYSALTAALQGFAGGSGRSVALVLSGGWRFDPGDDGGPSREHVGRDTRELVRRLGEVANASGFTLYTIDTPGAVPDPMTSAEVRGLDDLPEGLRPLVVQADGTVVEEEPDADVAAAGQFVGDVRSFRAFLRSWAEHDTEVTLHYLAQDTGGMALINAQRNSALRQAVADVSTYYRLGFYHSARADGAVREIEVKVDRPGHRVRSRRSFADLTTATRAQVALEQALLLGAAADAEPLAVRLGPPRPAGRRFVQVPYEVEIPLGEVAVRPAGRGRIATSLTLHIAVEDEEGRRNSVATVPIAIETVAAAVGGHVVWEGAVKLRRQGHEVLFALSDEASGRVFVGRAGLDG